jgi:hypothetical protein
MFALIPMELDTTTIPTKLISRHTILAITLQVDPQVGTLQVTTLIVVITPGKVFTILTANLTN